ncbi:ABC transporter substrate-binding protein [Bacillaceae bacterium IKA-2]|jgi:peptide/nickel transport system substrate-binding protein|nr:ABC transporter substrate-binding protein [Bacillaceae bacterium IKA-2]
MDRKLLRRLVMLLIVSLLALGLAACSTKEVDQEVDNDGKEANQPGTEVDEEAEFKSLVIGYEMDYESLDHIRTANYSDALILMLDRLVSRDYDFTYQPGLAKEWKISDDSLTWTFYLKEGVTFHDGKPFTADDVKWTFDQILDPDVGSPAAGDFSPIKEVNVIDEYTVDLVLEHAFPNLLFVISATVAGIGSQEAYEEYGDEYGSNYVIGTGPYKFKEWVRGDKIVLEINPDYEWGPDWAVDASIDEIVMRTIPEETSRIMEIEAGNVHILRDTSATIIERLRDSDTVDIHDGDAPRLGYLAYATDKEPFTDVRVRRAINHAINKEEIVEYIFRDNATVAHGYLPPMLTDEYYQGSEAAGYEYSKEKAIQLLEEAGYGDGLTLKLSAENNSEMTQFAQVIQNQLGEVGIEVEIQLYDSSSYVAMLREGEQELFLRVYNWLNADILDWFLESSQFPFPNHSRWIDDKTDELIATARSASSWEERAVGYHEVQKHLIEQAVWTPVYHPTRSVAVRKDVMNFKFHPWQTQFQELDLE